MTDKTNSSLSAGGRAAKPSFIPGITFLSLSTILLGLIVIGFMIQVGNIHAGASFLIGGLFALPLRPIMFIVPIILISGLVYALRRKSLYTRAELVCVLGALLIAPPIMTEGFWKLAVGAMITIPQSADMAKLDGYSAKMWPHGENIVEGVLSAPDAASRLGISGSVSWEDLDVYDGDIRSVPVLRNVNPEDLSTVRVPLSVFKGEELALLLTEPYLMTVLARAQDLEAESFYYCRIYYDDNPQFATEVFSSRELEQSSFLHRGGFILKGSYGVEFSADVQQRVYLELGLSGRGSVAFGDLSLLNVSAVEELYDGRKVVSREVYESLPPRLRGRLVVKPESMLSWEGIKLVVSGAIPFKEWKDPALFWFGYIALLLAGTFAMAVIMRKQWLENERYPIPVAQIPIRLLGLEASDSANLATGKLPAIWSDRLMWTGFGITLFWCVMKIWAAYNSNVPNLSINVPISPYFQDPSWGLMWSSVNFKVCSIFLGLAIFMELNVLMTIVLGFFLFRAQYWFGHSYGLTSVAGYPFQADQMNGAYLMYAVLVLFFTRKYLWNVLRRAFQGGRKAGEEEEVMSYRACFLSLAGCYIGVMLWADWAGIGVGGMLIFYTIMLLVSLVAAKLRAECGVPFSTYFPWSLILLVPLMGGTPLFIPSGFLFIAIISELLVIRPFLLLPGIQVEMIELARRARVVPRHMIYVCVIGVLGAWIVGGWFVLSNAYSTGMGASSSANVSMSILSQKGWWFRNYGSYIKKADLAVAAEAETVEAVEAVSAPDAVTDGKKVKVDPGVWGTVYGAGTVTVVALLRQFFAGFWFHPIGVIVGASWMAQEAWGSLLLAWLIRFTVLKVGGAATVRKKLLPFATGIFLGGTAAYLIYAVTVSYLKFFVPGTKSVWWTIWAL